MIVKNVSLDDHYDLDTIGYKVDNLCVFYNSHNIISKWPILQLQIATKKINSLEVVAEAQNKVVDWTRGKGDKIMWGVVDDFS